MNLEGDEMKGPSIRAVAGPGDPVVSGYVLYCFTRYQDCHEESAKVVNKDGLPGLLEYASRCLQDGSAMHDFHLFELGRELPLEMKEAEVPQPAVKTKRVALKTGA